MRSLRDVEQVVGPEALAGRIALATRDAEALDRVLELIREGSSRSAAIRSVLPDRPVESMLWRLREYEAGGRDALVSRRYVVRQRKMTDEVRGALRALATADPTASAEILAERVSKLFGTTYGNLDRPGGAPRARPGAAPGAADLAERCGCGG